MKAFRRKRRPGNRAMTKVEVSRVLTAKECMCVACYVRAQEGLMPSEYIAVVSDYNHTKSGNIRRGHGKGYALCLWHHKRQIEVDGWTFAQMTEVFGVSLLDGSRLFHEAYGSDDDLILLQDQLLLEAA